MSEMKWQDAVAKAMGAERCSPTDRRRAMQYLHETGIAEKIGGGLAHTIRTLADSGELQEKQDAQ